MDSVLTIALYEGNVTVNGAIFLMKSILSETLVGNVKRGDRKSKVQNTCETDFEWQLSFLLFINLYIYIF